MAMPAFEPPSQPGGFHRSRRRTFSAATRRSPGSHRIAAMTASRELLAKARRRQLLKTKRKARLIGPLIMGNRQLRQRDGYWEFVRKKLTAKLVFHSHKRSQLGCSDGGTTTGRLCYSPTVPFQNAFGPSSAMIFLAASMTPV